MMVIPDRVKIGGLVYDVNQTEYLRLGSDYGGEILLRELVINIRESLNENVKKRSLLHEVIHAICDNLGYGHDEQKIDMFTGALFALIVDNPEMFCRDTDSTKPVER